MDIIINKYNNKEEFITDIIKNNIMILKYIPEEYLDDRIIINLLNNYDFSSILNDLYDSLNISVDSSNKEFLLKKINDLDNIKNLNNIIAYLWFDNTILECSFNNGYQDLVYNNYKDSSFQEHIKFLTLIYYNSSKTLRKDYNFLLKLLSLSGEFIFVIPSNYQDENMILKAINTNCHIYRLLPEKFFNNRRITLAALKECGHHYSFIPEIYKNDKQILFIAYQSCIDTNEFENISGEILNDMYIINECIDKHITLNKNTSLYDLIYDIIELRNTDFENEDKMLSLVKFNGIILAFGTDNIKSNKKIVLEAVKTEGLALHFVSNELRNDQDIIITAIKNDGEALEYTPYQFRNDRKIIYDAVENNGKALRYASSQFQNDKTIVLVAVNNNGLALEYASERLKNDKDIVYAAVKNNGLILEYVSPQLQNDRDIVLAAVQQNGEALKYTSLQLQNDRDIVLAAVQQNGEALNYTSLQLQNDRDIVLAAVQQNGEVLKYTSLQFKNDRDVVLTAVKQNGKALQYVSLQLQNDRDITYAAVNNNGLALEHTPEKFQNDREIVTIAINNNAKAFDYVSNELKNDKDIIINYILINNYIKTCDKYEYYEIIKIINSNLNQLIHNLQYNYDTKYIQFNDLFLDNIEYIFKTQYSKNILEHILNNQKDLFIQNYHKFEKVIVNNEENLLLCQEYKIKFTSKEEFTSIYKNEDITFTKEEINNAIQKYEFNNSDFKIIWY
jgi:hypothetical protein